MRQAIEQVDWSGAADCHPERSEGSLWVLQLRPAIYAVCLPMRMLRPDQDGGYADTLLFVIHLKDDSVSPNRLPEPALPAFPSQGADIALEGILSHRIDRFCHLTLPIRRQSGELPDRFGG